MLLLDCAEGTELLQLSPPPSQSISVWKIMPRSSPKSRKSKVMLIAGVPLGIMITVIGGNFTPNEKQLEYAITTDYGVQDPQFQRTIGALLGPQLIQGNSLNELVNGDQIFPSMLAAIRGAQKTICFETFIYWSGQVGQEFADALAERARSGVKVHILLDYVGSTRMEESSLGKLRDSGCEVVKFHPLKWYNLSRFNNRTHRKLLIVDGAIGFTGGVGIGDEWAGNADDPAHWRDTHFRVEGPVVAQMQATFMVNWIKTTSTVHHSPTYFPPLNSAGTQIAQVFHSSPDEGSENIRLMYLLSIAAARQKILLAQAYFVPDPLAIKMLVDASRRGVEVDIIVPGPLIDTKRVRRAGRSLWGELLEAGVRISEYQPTNFHCKIMVVDGIWSSVGSTNFDNRSFRLNDEANLNVYDTGFAQKLEQTFAADKIKARAITYEEWNQRSWQVKLTDWFWSLFQSQM